MSPRTRSSDIAHNIDTRGDRGFILAAGNRLPDGREYRRIDGSATILAALTDMRPAHPRLLYLATFNWRERAEIRDDAALRQAIKDAPPADWQHILAAHRAEKAKRIMARTGPATGDAMRRQALSDLDEAAAGYASLQDGRRNGLFSVSCRLVRYVVNSVITEHELRAALLVAASANGAITQHGRSWFDDTLRRALAFGARDQLPPVARRFQLEHA